MEFKAAILLRFRWSAKPNVEISGALSSGMTVAREGLPAPSRNEADSLGDHMAHQPKKGGGKLM